MLIHELMDTKTGDIDEIVLHVISNKLNIKMSQISIDKSQRLGKRKGPDQKPQATIVKFTRTFERNWYFCYRKPFSEKDETPQERERTTWFCQFLDTR